MNTPRFILGLVILLECNLLIESFSLKLNAISSVNLATSNASMLNQILSYFEYPTSGAVDELERFRVLQVDESKSFITLGARNRLLTINSNDFERIQVYESDFPMREKSLSEKNCSDRNCANYILAILPVSGSSSFNRLVCGTYYGLFQCSMAEQNKYTGTISSYDVGTLVKAPKSITSPLNSNRNAFFLSHTTLGSSSSDILYAASSWTEHSQYLSVHLSHNSYMDDTLLSKKIGVSKSFVRFLDPSASSWDSSSSSGSNKLFLFQNEFSYDFDDGEKDRDILVSTSLVTQICRSDQDILNGEIPFYSELTAKIYCFNEAFRSNSGNSRNFKFDTLEFVTDFIEHKPNGTNTSSRKLFYGVFNTPKNQITGTAICFFDVDDLASVFHKSNFKYLDNAVIGDQVAKNTQLNPQDCPARLSPVEKLKYKSFTSKLSYMAKAALPIRKRKASFITTNDYRISCLHVVDEESNRELFESMQPSVKRLPRYQYLNIIFVGTDNGKLMRIAHYFSSDYFLNDLVDEEHVEILEEIQLFDESVKIKEIHVLKGDTNKKLFAVGDKQIKAISLDFCEMYSQSCDECVKHNTNSLYATKCYWINNSCQSSLGLNQTLVARMSDSKHCEFLRLSRTTTTTTTTTTSVETTSRKRPLTSMDNNEPERLTSSKFFSQLLNQIDANSSNSLFMVESSNKEYPTANGTYFLHKDPKKPASSSAAFINIHNSTNENDKASIFKSSQLILILVVLAASVIALISGILIGYLIKATYSKKILKQFDNMIGCDRSGSVDGGNRMLSKKKSSSVSTTSSQLNNKSDTSSTLSRTASSSTSGGGCNHGFKSSLAKHRQNLEMDINQSIMHKMLNSDKEMITSSDDSAINISCHTSPNGTTTGGATLNKTVAIVNFADTKKQTLYTIQNDYGLKEQVYYLNSDSSLKQDRLNMTSFNMSSKKKKYQNGQQQQRSSTSSSHTDSSLYGLFSMINSQTCLLNKSPSSFEHSCNNKQLVVNTNAYDNNSIKVSDECSCQQTKTVNTPTLSSSSSSSSSTFTSPTNMSHFSSPDASKAKKPSVSFNGEANRYLRSYQTNNYTSNKVRSPTQSSLHHHKDIDDSSSSSINTPSTPNTFNYLKNCLNDELINYSKVEDALFMNNSYV